MSDDPIGFGRTPPPPYLVLTIRSARYGPCEESRHQRRSQQRPPGRGRGSRRGQTIEDGDGDRANDDDDDDDDDNATTAWERRWTRDVTRVVADCLRRGSMGVHEADLLPDGDPDDARGESNQGPGRDNSGGGGGGERVDPFVSGSSSCSVRIRSVNRDGMTATLIPVELNSAGNGGAGGGGGGGGMNVAFGDPCPGTTKRLHVEYAITEPATGNGPGEPTNTSRLGSPDVHRMSFAEHEPVLLRRHLYHNSARREEERGREPIGCAQDERMIITDAVSDATDPIGRRGSEPLRASADVPAWAEPVLPLVLPWLTLAERVACHQVCGTWRRVLQTWGLATTIDNSPSFEDDDGCRRSGGKHDPHQGLTVPVLRGLLLHSFASLQSLYVSGMIDLQKSDLHPALPSMKRLRAIDISYCPHLDDETLHVLASPTGTLCETLQVLYIKGLRSVTDAGLVALASCHNLRVIDVSGLVNMTDQSGTRLGESLLELRAWYGRDNYRITRLTVFALVESCPHLEQLTLWGCYLLENLPPPAADAAVAGGYHHSLPPLVLLNLWGCHSLGDDAARALVNMSQLQTLIVSECHKLTDRFVFAICQQAPGLQHLLMRYCPRITDEGVNAIARSLKSLFSLDVSCCPRVTSASLAELLLRSCTHLVELRIARSRGLDLVTRPDTPHRRYRNHPAGELGDAGNVILKALRQPECRLALLDVASGIPVERGQARDQDNDELRLFASAMESLGFTHRPEGFFARHCHQATEVCN